MYGWLQYEFCFFFSSRRRHTRLQGDWSSDVCSSDLSLGMAFTNAEPPPPVVDVQGREDQTDVRVLVQVLKAHDFTVSVHSEEDCQQRLQIGRASCRERV